LANQDIVNCPICNGQKAHELFSKTVLHPLWSLNKDYNEFRLAYHICEACGYVYLNPRLSADEYGQYYQHIKPPPKDSFIARKPMVKERIDFILRGLKTAAGSARDTIIEVGPAYGDFLLLMPEYMNKIGIEPSEYYCTAVKQQEPSLKYFRSTLENVLLNYPALKESGDLVVASHVLEHAHNPRSFIQCMKALVKKGGTLYIEVPSIEALKDCELPLYQTLHFGHISQFTFAVINQLCESESMECLAKEISAKLQYPVLRALYKIPNRIQETELMFSIHSTSVDAQTQKALKILRQYINQASQALLLWGFGSDLFEVLNLLTDKEWKEFEKIAVLADINPDKQNRLFKGMPIKAPQSFSGRKIDKIIISSRSQLLKNDIIQSAKSLFPQADYIVLYD